MTHLPGSTLAGVAWRAAYLYERAAPAQLEAALSPEQRADLAAAISDPPDPARLETYLAWSRLADGAAVGTAEGGLAFDKPRPPWVLLLEQVDPGAGWPFPETAPGLPPLEPLPFQELLFPFTAVFHTRLAESAGWERLSLAAQRQLCYGLLRSLAGLSQEYLYLEFQAFRSAQPFGELSLRLARPGSELPTGLYQQFIQRTAASLPALFQRCPVLARLLAETTTARLRAAAELLERLEGDLPRLEAWRLALPGAPAAPLGLVAELRSYLSDRHHGGRSVAILAFENGWQVVYKPRSLGLERGFNALLAWMNTHAAPYDQKVLGVLEGEGYGWMEFAPYQECPDAAALGRFYQRLGMLLGLFYVLEGTDCHLENLVACGEYPLLVDSETLFHPQAEMRVAGASQAAKDAYVTGSERLARSVLRPGLLPAWQVGKDRRGLYDVSGLGAFGEQALPYRYPRFSYTNTDAMQMRLAQATLTTQENVPRLDGQPALLEQYAADLQAGFTSVYQFLLARRQDLLAENGPLQAFHGCTARFVFRSTQVYATLLREAGLPRRLRDGLDYSLVLERLQRVFLHFDQPPAALPLGASERRALYALDIPYFAAPVDGTDLLLEDGAALEQYFPTSSFQRVRQNLEGLGPEDLAFQAQLIEMSLRSRLGGEAHAVPAVPAQPGAPLDGPAAPRAPQDLAGQALSLAHDLQRRAIQGADGSAAWIGLSYLPEARQLLLSLSSLGLYDALAGIALFLAAAFHASGGPHLRTLGLAALQPVRQALGRQDFSETVQTLGLGGATGLGGLLYSLARCAEWLEEASLLDEAVQAAALLSQEQVQADQQLDIIGGAAGCILGLLAVQRLQPGPAILERLAWCGRRLLERQTPAGEGAAWPDISGRFLTGFSHGAAGYAVALLRLARLSGEAQYLQAARRALAYEDGLFNPQAGNWPDLRLSTSPDPAQPGYANAWCHGSSGIGLARLEALPEWDSPQIQRDLQAALAATRSLLQHSAKLADHLCCGNLGRIELLYSAGLRLGQPELVDEARQHAARLAQNAAALGGFRFETRLERGQFNPGLFNGAAGVGYELLRLSGQPALPAVLLWE